MGFGAGDNMLADVHMDDSVSLFVRNDQSLNKDQEPKPTNELDLPAQNTAFGDGGLSDYGKNV